MADDLKDDLKCLELARAASTRRLNLDRHRVSPDVARALDVIGEHLFETGFGSADLLRELGARRDTLARQFHAELGESVAGYIHLVRLIGALQPLGRMTISLKRIADALGWETQDAFGKAFHRTFGMPPSEARKKLHADHADLVIKTDSPPSAPRLPPDERKRIAAILARELSAFMTTPSRRAMLEDGRIRLDPMVLDLMNLDGGDDVN